MKTWTGIMGNSKSCSSYIANLAISGQSLANNCLTSKMLLTLRSDNEVKNHLYSKLRKALRKLNKVIKENFKKEFKEIKQNLIYKII